MSSVDFQLDPDEIEFIKQLCSKTYRNKCRKERRKKWRAIAQKRKEDEHFIRRALILRLSRVLVPLVLMYY
jgi:hypothetical protein